MQPGMLSVEPLFVLSIALLIFMAVPGLGLFTYKASPMKRLVVVVPCMLGLCFYFLWLGEAVGRSKAWYHWRAEYKDPLYNLQLFIVDARSETNQVALDEFHRRFAAENIQAYGHEKLFKPGPFSVFVQNLTEPTNQVQKPR